MIILGIDPGSLVTGYGIVESQKGRERLIACGSVVNRGADTMPERLRRIYDALTAVIERYHPSACAVETAFCGRNAQSALKLGHARGVALLASVMHGLPAYEYSPREVKRAIVGTGAATKEQVRYMVRTLLALRTAPRPLDVSDAIAVSLCHLHRHGATRPGAPRNGKPGTHTPAGQPQGKGWKGFVETHPERLVR